MLNIGERGGRRPAGSDRSPELGERGLAGNPAVGADAQREPGVVIEPGQDLGAGAAGEGVVGEVGLPALVGLLGGEPDVGGLRALARLGGDQAAAGQVPDDQVGGGPR
jgi:hypothetical protein